MLGFIIGTACLIALIMVLRSEHRRRGGKGWGCGSGWHHGWHGRCSAGSEGWGRYAFLRSVLTKLETTPGQEKVIRAAVDEFLAAAKTTKDEMWQTKDQLASIFRSESFDETLVSGLITSHDEAIERVRTAAIDAVAKTYEALDERQRELVAKWLESKRGGPWGGPYRTAAKV